MKAYFAALINKSSTSRNSRLAKKLLSGFKKSLKTPNSNLHFKEHNTFIFLAADTPLKTPLSQGVIEQTEANVNRHLSEYYLEYKSDLQKHLTTRQELKETSQIARDFLEEIDPKLAETFSVRLRKALSELPEKHYELHKQSVVGLWDLDEEHKARALLSGWTRPVFDASKAAERLNLEALVDKAALFNFLWIFTQPTTARLREMNKVLERLQLSLQGTHYRSNDSKAQAKFEMLFRILTAKLNALQNVDKTLSSIFGLFSEPQLMSDEDGLLHIFDGLQPAFEQMAREIDEGQRLLATLRENLDECQTSLREYSDETENETKTTTSREEFRLSLRAIADLSSDLFVEAELLKAWVDFFGLDLPYFTYQTRLFSEQAFKPTETSDDNVISVRGLAKNYNLGRTTVYALRGVDLDVREGEFVAIVGNSGAGKTTLLNCMAGLDEPDYGIVLFRGKNLHKMTDDEKSKTRLIDMGFIFQSYALLPHYTARENVALPADLAGLSHDLKTRIEDLLQGVGISEQATQYPAQLSGGQMQRVAIARALTNRPKVLFADEPTGDLDSKTGRQVMELIKKFHEETKTTVIVITHEQSIADYAERQITLEDGIFVNSKRAAKRTNL
jgi:putative ABC transport system ATP-binding protein